MSETNKFKQNVALISICLACVASFAVVGAIVGLFWIEEEQESQPDSPTVLLPLVVEPNRIDFQGKGEGEGETHEGVVYLTNQSDRTIALLFADSTCRCSVAELPGDTILSGEKLPMKCTLSTAGRISDRAGGEIWIAYRFANLD